MTQTQFSIALLSISTLDSDDCTIAMTGSTKPLHSRSLLRAYSPSLLTLLQHNNIHYYDYDYDYDYDDYDDGRRRRRRTTTTDDDDGRRLLLLLLLQTD